MYVAALPLRGRDGKLVGWLHVGSVAGPLPWQGWGWSLAAALTLAAVVALLLFQLIGRRLQAPLAASRAAAEELAGGRLPLLANRRVRDPATQYQSILAEHLHGLRRRNEMLQLKIGEVRATHFDPAIVATLDELALPLAARQPATQQAQASDGSARRSGSALQRALLATIAAMAVVIGCGLVLYDQIEQADQRRLLDSGAQMLQQAWRAELDQDRLQLDAELDRLLATPGISSVLAGADTPALNDALAHSVSAGLTLAVFNADGSLRAAAGPHPEDARIDPPSLSLLRRNDSPGYSVHGIWQNRAREYQSSVARSVDLRELGQPAGVIIMAARALDQNVARLRARLQISLPDPGAAARLQVAVVDLRGHALADGQAALARQWTESGRSNFIAPGNERAAMVIALGLSAPSGHALGTLLAQWPLPPRLDTVDKILILLGVVVAVASLAMLLLYLRNQFVPLALATRELERLADGDTDEQEPLQQNRESRLLNRMIRRIAEKMDALETLRRSRERQGKRQARFIRQQMMQLADRLDAAARRGILEELERIEHARRPAETPDALASHTEVRTERIADEFGVLALGFQNLVSRVGQQYQELDRLVSELREALRTKTQFIALQQELEIARKMQASILPREFAAHDALALHAIMQPAKEVGGDFYDFFDIDANRVALVVADVSGKGVPAAFFMAISRTLLRAVAPYADSAAECISRVNDLLAVDNEEMMFVTMFYAIVDTRDGSLSYINAGHNMPFLLRADGSVGHPAVTRGIALAVAEDMQFEQGSIRLEKGDGLFLYTDGITEANEPQDEELFGEPRLAAVLEEVQALPVEQITVRVVERVKQFEAGGPQADDITCLMVRYRGAR
jgi:serine phosphatase RsbU (regulator of sigma subunit)